MAGVITNIETIRPSKIRTRSLRAAEMADLNELCGGFLQMYGLRLGSVVKESLIPVASHPRATVGILQRDLRYAITLLHAVGSAAVCASGLGLGKSDVIKRMVDRSASGVQGVGLHEILKASGNAVAVIAAAEGERVKPGEAGGNPARFRGEVFGPEALLPSLKMDEPPEDVKVINVITDDVDGTGKATEGLYNSATAGLYTKSRVKPLPDEYMIKLISSRELPGHVTVDSPPEVIVDAFSRIHGVPRERLNFFCLNRKRHDAIMNEIADKGPNFIRDKDGDVMPAVSAAIAQYIFENGYPLHGIVGNVGGSAEAGLVLPVIWRGGTALLQFASKKGLKSNNWEDRLNFDPKEISSIRKFGFDPSAQYQLTDFFSDPFADGIAVYGANTDVYWMDPYAPANKGLIGVKFGLDAVTAHAVEISSNGLAEILHFVFDYAENRKSTERLLTPFLTILLNLKDAGQVDSQVDQMLADNPERLKREICQEYYLAIDFIEGKIRIDEPTYASLREEGKTQRFFEADDAILASVKSKKPEWFTGDGG